MVTVRMGLGLLAVVPGAAVDDARRRRRILEANLPAEISGAARRKVRRAQRVRDRAERARYAASIRTRTGRRRKGGGL